jgi:glucosyl-3-phosphoglycerate synthase
VEGKVHQSIFETPQTVSWERVHNKLPGIYYDLIDVVEREKLRFA